MIIWRSYGYGFTQAFDRIAAKEHTFTQFWDKIVRAYNVVPHFEYWNPTTIQNIQGNDFSKD